MLKEEMALIRLAMGHEDSSAEDFRAAEIETESDLVWLPNRNEYCQLSVSAASDKVAVYRFQLEAIRTLFGEEAKRAAKLEQKLKLLTQGYQVR